MAAGECGPSYSKYASRYCECCRSVTFNEWAEKSTGEIKYTYGGGKPCRQRLCPTCQHLKSRVLVAQLQQVYDTFKVNEPETEGLLLTLTVKNCSPDNLRQTIKQMHHAFGKLRRRVEFETSIRAFFRSSEVTVNNKGARTYHPHMHVLLMVPRSYFKRSAGLYITHDEWVRMWRECLGVEYNPIVGITAVTEVAMAKRENRKGSSLSVRGAIREVAKYCVKPEGYQEVVNGKYWTDPNVFKELLEGLRGHRLYAWGGEFDKIRKELALKDVENPDTDLDDELQNIERPSQNYKHIAKVLMTWRKLDAKGNYGYVPVSRLDLATGETQLFEAGFRGGG